MSTEQQSNSELPSRNLNELVKKIVLAFCEVNVSFCRSLDIYGSIHVRADDRDVSYFLLNEHCYRQSPQSGSTAESVFTRHVSGSSGNDAACVTELRTFGTTDQCSSSAVSAASDSTSSTTRQQPLPQSKSESDPRRPNSQKLSADIDEFDSPAPERSRSRAENDTAAADGSRALQINRDDSQRISDANANDDYDVPEDEFSNGNCIELTDDDDSAVEISESTDVKPAAEYKQFLEQIIKSEAGDLNYHVDGNDPSSVHYDSSVSLPGQYPSVPYPTTSSSTDYFNSDALGYAGSVPSQNFNNTNNVPRRSVKVCRFCMRYFPTAMELRDHIQTVHASNCSALVSMPPKTRSWSTLCASGEFSCPTCALPFRTMDGLRCHENSKHYQNKLYRCRFCSQAFLTRQASYTHRIKFHRLGTNKNEQM